MLRTYAIVLVLAAIAAALVGRMPQGSKPAAAEVITIKAPPVGSSNSAARPGQTINELDQSIELTRQPNGYFYADVQVNGAPVHMVVDTGATVIALSRDDAQAAGLAMPIAMDEVIGRGADGVVKGEEVSLDRVTLGGKTAENIPGIVMNSGGQSLLGQSFLSQFASVKIEGDKMVLR
jgi:aspartyl protease family protein